MKTIIGTYLHLLVICVLILSSLEPFHGNQTFRKASVPAVLLFGDSILDPGNNNHIKTLIKCDFPPYGKDFTGHLPTGRFSNGRIPGDFIASSLGVKELMPAYLSDDLGEEELLTGVSFASGSTGYDPITSILASVLSMEEQLKLFGDYKEKVKAIIGRSRADRLIDQSLFIVCAGSNDFANTYFSSPFRFVEASSYASFLVATASDFIQKLYEMGARRIGFVGLPPIGCLPSQITLAGDIMRGCVEAHNQAALLYNSKISEEIKRLAAEFIDTKLIYLDIYPILYDIIQRPNAYGFEVSNKGCCGTGELEASILCNSKSALCSDDTKYIFWDSFHPTEKAYKVMIDKLLQNYSKLLI